MDRWLTVLGLFFAAVAGGAAVLASVAALKTLRLQADGLDAARETVRLAEEARKEAEASRLSFAAAEERSRLYRVGDLVESIFLATSRDDRYVDDRPSNPHWWAERNRLRHNLEGLRPALSACQAVVEAVDWKQANSRSPAAREEVTLRLHTLDGS